MAGVSLGVAQAAVGSWLDDTCVVTDTDPQAATLNPSTLALTPAATSTIYSGACRIWRLPLRRGRKMEGADDVLVKQWGLRLPTGTTVDERHTVTVTAVSETVGDPTCVGVYKIVDVRQDRSSVIATLEARAPTEPA